MTEMMINTTRSAYVLALVAVATLAWAALPAIAHPTPNVPVRSWFEPDGSGVIEVEIDPRSFEEDPEQVSYLYKVLFDTTTDEERAEMVEQARDFLERAVAFEWEPNGVFEPSFTIGFEAKPAEAFEQDADVVMIVAKAKVTIPNDARAYRVRALPDVNHAGVLFLNHLTGKAVERIHNVFPGENSFWLDLTGLPTMSASSSSERLEGSVGVTASMADRWATLFNFVRKGFFHIVGFEGWMPGGLDHILFVLGLFLLSRHWRPLLWQVTAFTVAHTITLGMATLGLVSMPSNIVEPIIAGSIAFVALENLFHPKYTPWRTLVVFVFGLVHGLGFAGALSAENLPPASLIVGLLGFNVGVELGQLLVIAIAFAVTVWLRQPERYRRLVVVPGSVVIAALGLLWMVQRIV